MTSSVPPVPTAAVGQLISAGWWNNSAAPPISWLMDPDKCDVANVSGTAIANGGTTLMTWDTEYSDTQGMHSTSSNLSRVTLFAPGRYSIKLYLTLPAATYTQLDVEIRKNGGTTLRTFTLGTTTSRQNIIEMDYVFGSGEYWEAYVSQTSGASRTTSTGGGLYANGCQTRWVCIS